MAFDLSYAFRYRDAETLGRLMMAPAGIAELVGREHEAEVREQIVERLAANRQGDGSYRLENEFHYVVAKAEPNPA